MLKQIKIQNNEINIADVKIKDCPCGLQWLNIYFSPAISFYF